MATVVAMADTIPHEEPPRLPTFAARLAYIRGRANMNADQLALAAQLGRSTIRKLEGDPTRVPDGATVAAVCDVLGCSADWLLRGLGRPTVRGRASAGRRAVRS